MHFGRVMFCSGRNTFKGFYQWFLRSLFKLWKRIENLQQFSRELEAIFKFVVARGPLIFNCPRHCPGWKTISWCACWLIINFVLLLQSDHQMSNLCRFLSRYQSVSQYLRSCHVSYVLWVFRPFQHTTFYTLNQIIDLATHFCI